MKVREPLQASENQYYISNGFVSTEDWKEAPKNILRGLMSIIQLGSHEAGGVGVILPSARPAQNVSTLN